MQHKPSSELVVPSGLVEIVESEDLQLNTRRHPETSHMVTSRRDRKSITVSNESTHLLPLRSLLSFRLSHLQHLRLQAFPLPLPAEPPLLPLLSELCSPLRGGGGGMSRMHHKSQPNLKRNGGPCRYSDNTFSSRSEGAEDSEFKPHRDNFPK
jgi:hypothetical protein